MRKKSTRYIAITTCLLLASCSLPSPPQETMDCDYTMFLPMDPLTLTHQTDLNHLSMSQHLEEKTGLVIDYHSPMPGQEDITFTFDMASQEMKDIFRYDLAVQYAGGVETAIEDGMIHDYSSLLEEYAPHFMRRIQEYDDYTTIAYTDNGILSQFGATLVDEELRGLPTSGPILNKTYLDQVGLEVPETIAQWETVLAAFAELDIIPFSFGADQGFYPLYDTFASAYGVTMGEMLFQENGVVKCSPLEDGYYDLLVMLHQWYSNGWIRGDFYSQSHQDTIKADFEKGAVGASVFSTNTLLAGTAEMEFVPAPYPVLQEGDTIKTRDYIPDFYNAPIFIHSRVENPAEVVEWIDFFYSEEGVALSNWGIEGETYTINSQGEKEFTALVLENPDTSPHAILNQEGFQEMSLVKEWELESQFHYPGVQDEAWKQWGKATCENILPDTMTYTQEEINILTLVLYSMETKIYQSTVNFITGLQPLSEYDAFLKDLQDVGIQEVIDINQAALDRYLAR